MTAGADRVRSGFLASGVPAALVDEVLDAYGEAKRRFYLADLRPSALEGGRFSEAVFRILQWAGGTTVTPLGRTLPRVDALLSTLQGLPSTVDDSIRLHIPRTLRLIYDIRNKRDIGHLADGIDPNVQDSTLVIANMSWTLAELVRLYHKVSPAEAQQIIDDLVAKQVPAIQVFDGEPRLLRNVTASDHALAILYWRSPELTTLEELRTWVRPSMVKNLKRTLQSLNEKDLVHGAAAGYRITHLGERHVESRKLIESS